MVISEGRVGGLEQPADLSARSKARPFLISNIMGLEEGREEVERGGREEEEREEELGGVSPGVSPGPDSDPDLTGADEDTIAKVSFTLTILYFSPSKVDKDYFF